VKPNKRTHRITSPQTAKYRTVSVVNGTYYNVLLEERFILNIGLSNPIWRFYDILDVFSRYSFINNAISDYKDRIIVTDSKHTLTNASNTILRVSSDGVMHMNITLFNNTNSGNNIVSPASFFKISGSGFPSGTGTFRAIFKDPLSNEYYIYDAVYESGTVYVTSTDNIHSMGQGSVRFIGSCIIGL